MLLTAPPLAQTPPRNVEPIDLDRPALVLAQDPDRGPADVRPGRVAAVVEEGDVLDPEPPTADEDGAAATTVDASPRWRHRRSGSGCGR